MFTTRGSLSTHSACIWHVPFSWYVKPAHEAGAILAQWAEQATTDDAVTVTSGELVNVPPSWKDQVRRIFAAPPGQDVTRRWRVNRTTDMTSGEDTLR